jgi:hypothetical protein
MPSKEMVRVIESLVHPDHFVCELLELRSGLITDAAVLVTPPIRLLPNHRSAAGAGAVPTSVGSSQT